MRTFDVREIEWTPDRIRRFWAYLAHSPHADRTYFSSHSGDAVIRFVKHRVALLPQQRLLDWGCGPGYLLERLCRGGYTAEGLEFSEDSLRQATERVGAFPTFRGVTLVDTVPTPLAAATFDVVFLIEVIEHLPPQDIDATIGEIHRLLKPGGTIVITTPHDENLAAASTVCPDCGLVFHPWQHVGSFTAPVLARLVRSRGFVPVYVQPTTIGASRLSRAAAVVRRILGRGTPQPHLVCIATRA